MTRFSYCLTGRLNMRSCAAILALFLALLVDPADDRACAARLLPDDLLVTAEIIHIDFNTFETIASTAIVKIDPVTGETEYVTHNQMASGPEVTRSTGLHLHDDGFIYLANGSANAIVRIDPETGNREHVLGEGTQLKYPWNIDRLDAEHILVSSTVELGVDDPNPGEHGVVIKVNTVTGQRRFGRGSGAATANSLIPEPHTIGQFLALDLALILNGFRTGNALST